VPRLWASSALAGSLDWSGGSLVLKGEREVRAAVTSHGPAVGAVCWLELLRRHWAFEHQLPWLGDVPLSADGCQAPTGTAPQVLAAVRHLVRALLRQRGGSNVAAALRDHGWQPHGTPCFLSLAHVASTARPGARHALA
jgi:hypothetical protein